MSEWAASAGALLLPPGAILVAAGLLTPLLRPLGRPVQKAVLLAAPVIGLLHLFALPEGSLLPAPVFGGAYMIELMRVDALSRVFGTIFYIAAFLSTLYALHVDDDVQDAAAGVYAGSAIGAVFAGDLISLFVYWELTAVSSVLLIWARRTERAYRAGLRYVLVQVASGVLLLAGAALHYDATGGVAFDTLGLVSPGTALIFVAFGMKAAFPLLHNWLQDAYPEATPTGTVFLSAFTTKLAIYALARGFPGTEILIPIGAIMTAFPIFYAVIENDLRRVLAYSLNNQLGYMVVGIGIGTPLALNGAAAHAFAHIIYKGLLFMSMGAVLMRTGTVNGSDLGGLYKSMPFTTVFCIIGAAAISAFPLFSGFATKSMVLSAAEYGHMTWVYLILLFASAGVFHHSGIKIPFFAFFGHDRGLRVREAPLHMLLAMGLAAALCIGLGIFYEPLYRLLPYPDAALSYQVYTPTHVWTTLQLLMFSALAFALLMRTGIYPPELHSTNLDFDWTYRRAAPVVVARITVAVQAVRMAAVGLAEAALARGGAVLRRTVRPPGILGEPWLTGETALFAALLLVGSLVAYYI
jgi:multicomponent Na+:H+ antiporter subunit D